MWVAGAGLGHAVALEYLDVETGCDLIGEFGAQRRRARDDRLEGGQVVAVHERVLGEGKDDRRYQVGAGHGVVLHDRQELLEVEAGKRHGGDALSQHEVHEDLQPVHVEVRQDGHNDIVGFGGHHGCALHQVRNEVAVREHHPFGVAGRATGVGEDGHGVGHVHRCVTLVRVAAHQGERVHDVVGRLGLAQDDDASDAASLRHCRPRQRQEKGDREQPRGARIVDLVAQFTSCVGGVDGGDRAAAHQRAMEGDGVLGDVRGEDHQNLPRPEATRHKPAGESLNHELEGCVVVGAPRRTVDKGCLGGMRGGVLEDVRGNRDVGDRHVRQAARDHHRWPPELKECPAPASLGDRRSPPQAASLVFRPQAGIRRPAVRSALDRSGARGAALPRCRAKSRRSPVGA